MLVINNQPMRIEGTLPKRQTTEGEEVPSSLVGAAASSVRKGVGNGLATITSGVASGVQAVKASLPFVEEKEVPLPARVARYGSAVVRKDARL